MKNKSEIWSEYHKHSSELEPGVSSSFAGIEYLLDSCSIFLDSCHPHDRDPYEDLV